MQIERILSLARLEEEALGTRRLKVYTLLSLFVQKLNVLRTLLMIII